jgi:hypothetical protein
VTKEFSDFLKLYGVTGVFGDNYGGEWPKAEFAKNGINYELSELHKSDLYLNLANLPLRYGAAEPVLETRRADTRVVAGGEALIV